MMLLPVKENVWYTGCFSERSFCYSYSMPIKNSLQKFENLLPFVVGFVYKTRN